MPKNTFNSKMFIFKNNILHLDKSAQKWFQNLAVSEPQWVLLVLCVLVAALFLLAPRLNNLAFGSIDPSFNYALNEASSEKKAFGTDFIATYGPLNYFVTNSLPRYVLVTSLAFAAYASLLGVGVYLFVKHFIVNRAKRFYVAPLLIYTLAITNGGGSIEWNYLTAFLLYCFVLIKTQGKSRQILIILLTIVASLFLLTKFTLGFSSITALVLICLFSWQITIKARVIYTTIVGLIFSGVFLTVGRYLGITSPIDYIKTAFIESNNFSSAMSAYDKQTFMATIFIAAACLLLLSWPLIGNKRYLLRTAFIIPALFTIWKYSVIRQDGHLLRFLQFGIPIACLMYYSFRSKKASDKWILASIVALSVLAVFANKLPFYGPNSFYATITSPISNVVIRNPLNFLRISEQKNIWAEQSGLGLQYAALPKSMTAKIGSKGVDIFPWETSIIAANNLHWVNRPSPFSFESYDPYLDNANSTFIESVAAPEYIVWHNTGNMSIDGRHILWDEPMTFRAILSRYELIESNQNFMLLQRRTGAAFASGKIVSLKDISAASKNKIIFKKSQSKATQPIFISITIKQPLTAKLETSLIRGQAYYMTVKTQDGKSTKYRLLTANASQGILINGLPKTWDQLISLVASGQITGQKNTSVDLIKISTE